MTAVYHYVYFLDKCQQYSNTEFNSGEEWLTGIHTIEECVSLCLKKNEFLCRNVAYCPNQKCYFDCYIEDNKGSVSFNNEILFCTRGIISHIYYK